MSSIRAFLVVAIAVASIHADDSCQDDEPKTEQKSLSAQDVQDLVNTYFKNSNVSAFSGFDNLLERFLVIRSDRIPPVNQNWDRPFYRQKWVPESPLGKANLQEYRRKIAESRAIVTRKREAKTPTWDGRAAAFIIEPTIWYFDPNSRVHDVGFKYWQPALDKATSPKENPVARRTFAEFWLEGIEQYGPKILVPTENGTDG
jgi:hypothetical protein